ncbi:hypothetical protein OIU84_010568 [Salix udensis]|uniref:Uncharacterized protein n=1 Tax=Salix udensis TaxID=889485 RepID=A0AAD6JKZ8_9ROSI|nr:hypothetical protein OIU84_010568 [Salix udensis]
MGMVMVYHSTVAGAGHHFHFLHQVLVLPLALEVGLKLLYSLCFLVLWQLLSGDSLDQEMKMSTDHKKNLLIHV